MNYGKNVLFMALNPQPSPQVRIVFKHFLKGTYFRGDKSLTLAFGVSYVDFQLAIHRTSLANTIS